MCAEVHAREAGRHPSTVRKLQLDRQREGLAYREWIDWLSLKTEQMMSPTDRRRAKRQREEPFVGIPDVEAVRDPSCHVCTSTHSMRIEAQLSFVTVAKPSRIRTV